MQLHTISAATHPFYLNKLLIHPSIYLSVRPSNLSLSRRSSLATSPQGSIILARGPLTLRLFGCLRGEYSEEGEHQRHTSDELGRSAIRARKCL